MIYYAGFLMRFFIFIGATCIYSGNIIKKHIIYHICLLRMPYDYYWACFIVSNKHFNDNYISLNNIRMISIASNDIIYPS